MLDKSVDTLNGGLSMTNTIHKCNRTYINKNNNTTKYEL